MKTYEVRFLPKAESDLFGLYDYISAESGPIAAGAYLDRIEEACQRLAHFPHRGRVRNDLRAGLRIVGFERRAVIAFVVEGSEVVIARVLYGGRDYEPLLLGAEDD